MGSAVQVIHMEGVKRVIVPIFLIFITLSLFLLLKPSESIKDNSTKQQDERKSPADVQDCNAKAFTAIKLLNMTQSFMKSNKLLTNLAKAMKLKNKLADAAAKGSKVKLNQGSQSSDMKGFISCDYDELNMVKPEDWERVLGNKEVCGADAIFSEHVW